MAEHIITNADKIRAMSDEELADWLTELPNIRIYSRPAWLDWLEEEQDG